MEFEPLDPEFKIISLDEFLNLSLNESDENVEILDSGCSGSPSPTEQARNEVAPLKTNSENIDYPEITIEPIENTEEEDGLTEEDFLHFVDKTSDEDVAKLMADFDGVVDVEIDGIRAEEKPKLGDLMKESMDEMKDSDLTAEVEVGEFPLDLSEMSFDFVHEWIMISSGRKAELELMLRARLMATCAEIMAKIDKSHDQKEKEKLRVELSNVKLEIYAKLGLLQEMQALARECEKGLDFCQVDEDGLTLPARLCIYPCDPQTHIYCKIIEFLLTKYHGQDRFLVINRQSRTEFTSALMLCVKLGEMCKVNMLLKAGASVNLENHEGKTALSLATEKGNLKMVSVLMSGGANPQGTTSLSVSTTLELAIKNKHTPIYRHILNRSANMTQALRNLCGKILGDFVLVGPIITPVFCTNLREQPIFLTEFMVEREAFEKNSNRLNLLVVACIQQDMTGKYRSEKSTYARSVRVNGKKQLSILDHRGVINMVTMGSLHRYHINLLKLRLKHVSPQCTTKLLAQGFVCDFSHLGSENPSSASSSPSTPSISTPDSIPATPIYEEDSPFEFLDEDLTWDNRENEPPIDDGNLSGGSL